jgi:hypothetical protein
LVARSGAALWTLSPVFDDASVAVGVSVWAAGAAGISAAAFLSAAALGSGADLCHGRPTQHGAVTALVLAFFMLDVMSVLAGLFALTESASPRAGAGGGGGGNFSTSASPAATTAGWNELLSPAALSSLALDVVLVALSAVEFRTARWPWEIATAAAAAATAAGNGNDAAAGAGAGAGAGAADSDAGAAAGRRRPKPLQPPAALSPPDNAPFFMRISFFWIWPLIRRACVLTFVTRVQVSCPCARRN